MVNSKFVSTNGEIKKFSNKQNEPLLKNELAFVLSDVPNGRALARTFLVDKPNKYTLNQRIAGITPHSDIDAYYLYITMNRNRYFLQFDDGVKQTNLSLDDMQKYIEWYPKSIEQQQIGALFLEIDNLITLHQRKCDKLLNFKKSMLEKMFPKNSSNFPEIRFKGFTDAWEQRKWIDMVNISTEMVDPKSGKYDNLPHIGPGNIESFTGQFYDNIKKVGEENLISGKFHFYPEDIIYGKINPQLGKYVFPLFEGLSSADSYVLNAKNGLNQKYLYTLLQTTDFYKYSVSVSMRSGMPKINRDELNAYEFSMPKGNEQQQIGALFLEIDNLITLHQRNYIFNYLMMLMLSLFYQYLYFLILELYVDMFFALLTYLHAPVCELHLQWKLQHIEVLMHVYASNHELKLLIYLHCYNVFLKYH